MYRKDKIIIYTIFICVLILSYTFNFEFDDIITECVSIISFAIATYAICIGGLIGSPLAKELAATEDTEKKHKSQLGVLKEYIKNAMIIAIITLIVACVYKLNTVDVDFMYGIFDLKQAISSICLGLFSINFVYIALVFMFIINRQIEK